MLMIFLYLLFSGKIGSFEILQNTKKVVLKNLNMLYLLYFCYTSYILVFYAHT